jgi:GDPmannose 4,6-dehydratase
MMKKNVLITGITGQDGSFLTSHLLQNSDYQIIGTSREKNNDNFYKKLEYLNVESSTVKNLKIVQANALDYESINSVIKNSKIHSVYNLMGPSSVYESVADPFKSSKSIIFSFNNIVKALIENKNFPNFFQTSSSEMFEASVNEKLNEDSKFNPRSPYASSKLYIHNLISFLRKKYEWKLTSGILFNHESEFRPDNYLIMKIINCAIDIKNKKSNQLELGSLDVIRDWGFAGDHTRAMKMIIENNSGSDYVIGTGVGTSIEEVTRLIFNYFDLDFKEYISINKELLRSKDPEKIIANPTKLKSETGWEPSVDIENLIVRCIEYKIQKNN